MEELIDRIINIEEEAKSAAAEAEKKIKKIGIDSQARAEKLKKSISERSDAKVEAIRKLEGEYSEKKICEIKTKLEDSIEELSKRSEENKQKWIDEIINNILA